MKTNETIDSLLTLPSATGAYQALLSDGQLSDGQLSDGQPLAPALNMAVDTWLAEQAQLIPKQAILRIYRWSPAGISIGRNQAWARAISADSLGAGEVAIRRVTGGRAIFHDSTELTYSFVMPMLADGDPVVNQRHIANQIVESILLYLREAGVDAQVEKRAGYVPAHKTNRQSPHCFVSTARYELTVNGHKIVASAQRISGGRFFQHGSIKLSGVVFHPALFERSTKKVEAIGNISTPVECYTSRGGAVGSTDASVYTGEPHRLNLSCIDSNRLELRSTKPHALSPSGLRAAFAATFGAKVVAPTIKPDEWNEVLRLMADNDSIIGKAESAKDSSVVAPGEEPLIPRNSRLTPHVYASH